MKIGTKVICVKGKESIGLIKGQTYTITHYGKIPFFEWEYVKIKEVKNTDGYIGFDVIRFKKVDDDFAENLLRKLAEDLKKETANLN